MSDNSSKEVPTVSTSAADEAEDEGGRGASSSSTTTALAAGGGTAPHSPLLSRPHQNRLKRPQTFDDIDNRVPVKAPRASDMIDAASNAAVGGTGSTDLPEWLTCPCCFDIFEDPFIITCGHSVCANCLRQLLAHEQPCPTCQVPFERDRSSVKNGSLKEAIRSWKQIHASLERSNISQNKSAYLEQMLHLKALNVGELDHLIRELQRHSEQLKLNNETLGNQLLAAFLRELVGQKSQELITLEHQVALLRNDLRYAEERLLNMSSCSGGDGLAVDGGGDDESGDVMAQSVPSTSNKRSSAGSSSASSSSTSLVQQPEKFPTYRQRIDEHFDDLKETYFLSRSGGGGATETSLHSPLLGRPKKSLKDHISADSFTRIHPNNTADSTHGFANILGTVAQFSELKPLKEFYYNQNTNTSSAVSNIVSSISFDCYEEFFAVSGVCKQIKIYNYNDMLSTKVSIPFPVADIKVDAKVSCVCWLSCPRSRLVNADYEGNLTLWDAFNGKAYKEHEKRVWSVDASSCEPNLITSASDDGTVRLWSTENAHPVNVLQTRNKVNICSVQFHPKDSNYLAFGASDHFLYYYDLRHHREPLMVCKGHKKAVSYVTFCNSDEICTASIDGTLKLWSISSKDCVKTYTGHQNEKNFVGLDTNQTDWIACGSEDNSLYVYYKHVARPIAKYRFEVSRSQFQPSSGLDEPGGEFLSAVCWRRKENIVFAANSQGLVKLFQLC